AAVEGAHGQGARAELRALGRPRHGRASRCHGASTRGAMRRSTRADRLAPMSDPSAVLSDGSILRLVEEGRIRIEPWDPSLVQPASVDLRLGDSFRVFHNYRVSTIDLRDPPDNLTEEVVVAPEEGFVIHPGECCLGRTLEWVELPDDVVARIEGKALAVDTPVPTPDGWRTMGDLEP